MSAILDKAACLDAERAAALAMHDELMRIEDEFQSYARNSLMAAHFPEQLEAERKARRVIPQITTPEAA